MVDRLLMRTLNLTEWAQPLDPYRHSYLRSMQVPPLCACMIAFRNTLGVRNMVVGALRRLMLNSSPHGLRRDDQESLLQEFVHTLPPHVRLMPLPEEYYCPGRHHSPNKPAVWITPWAWSDYPCKAVHGHKLGVVESRAPPLRHPYTGNKGSTKTKWSVMQVPKRLRELASGHNATPLWLAYF